MSERTTAIPVQEHVDARRTLLRIAIAATATALLLVAPGAVHGQDWRSSAYSRQLSGEETLRVDVEYGAGELKLAKAAPGTLYRANLRYDAEVFTPEVSYRDNRFRFDMDGRGSVRGRNLDEGLLDLKLSPEVPLDLDLAFGAADASIDLGGLRVRKAAIHTGASRTMLSVSSPNAEICERIEIEVGAAKFEARNLGNLNAQRLALQGGVGEVILDFTGSWKQDLHATVEMGLGTLTLRVPEHLGVRVTKDGLLASFDSQGLIKRGDVYYSENWDNAKYKLSLELEAALGSIRVEWVD